MKLVVVLLLLLPFVELYLLLKLAEWIGAGLTLALIIVTAIVGSTIARRQRGEVTRQMQTQFEQDEVPAALLVDATMIRIGGALLILPGILTDLVGFLLLVPPVRRVCRAVLWRSFQHYVTMSFQASATSAVGNADERTIDAEVVSRRVTPESESRDPRISQGPLDARQDQPDRS